MFSLRNKCRLMKKSVNLNKYGPFFIIFPLPVMLKFTVHITAVHLFTCVAKAVTSRQSREFLCKTVKTLSAPVTGFGSIEEKLSNTFDVSVATFTAD